MKVGVLAGVLAVVSLLTLNCRSPENVSEPEKVILPKGEDAFFKNEAFTGSRYVRFRADGTYARITREHMFVEEGDRGSWTQDSAGVITMRSTMHFRNIEAGPFALWTWHTNVVRKLPQIHTMIEGFLRTNSSSEFAPSSIKRLVRLPGAGTNLYSPISTDHLALSISRRELAALLEAIQTFTNRTDAHHFHVTPMRYKTIDFLLWQDTETRDNRDLARIKASIDELKDKKEMLPYVYTAISRRQFEQEANTTHEFLFHPELNPPRKNSTGPE